MLTTTMGQILVNNVLPPELRNYNRILDKKGIQNLLQEVADKQPEKYRQISHDLSTVGYQVAQSNGGNSFGLRHMLTPLSAHKFRQQIINEIQSIYLNQKLTDKEKENKVIDLLAKSGKQLEDDIFQESLNNKNPLAYQVVSGSRGNKANLRSLLGGDLLYIDHRERPLPIPVVNSYSRGLTPAEYYAGTFGARHGVVNSKLCLSGDSEILLSDYKPKRISEIKPGDIIIGANTQGELFPVKVKQIFENGIRPCYRYLFRKGQTTLKQSFRELIATEDHKILAQIKAGRPGSVHGKYSVYTPTLLPLKKASCYKKDPSKNWFVAWPSCGEKFNRGIDIPEALLAGLMLGDGCMAPSTCGKYSLSCADKSLIDDITPYLAKFNLSLSPPKSGYSWYLKEIEFHGRDKEIVNGVIKFIPGQFNKTKRWLKEKLGEKLAHEKELPKDVWSWNDESLAALISGIYSSDSCEVSGKKIKNFAIKLNMTAYKLMVELQRLLELRFGIWTSSFRYIPVENLDTTTRHDKYEFSISHPVCVRRFAKRIKLVGIKQKQLEAALPNLSNDPSSREYGFKVFSKEFYADIPTFDIEVDHPDHMFVLSNGLIVSNSVTEGGALSKQINQIVHRLIVTARDSDKPSQFVRGYPVKTDDPDNEGGVLANSIGGYDRNTILTPKILSDLKSKNIENILVRSPITGGPEDGGVYALDVGVREKGNLPPKGDYVGLAAGQSLSEPLSQAIISAKHAGGVAGQAKGVSGFPLIEQLTQVPKTFKGGAAHARADGKVQSIQPAPQGGTYIMVNGEQHYVAPGFDVKVKVGQDIEAGDILSEGIPNPAKIVTHKGIGEGRRYFVDVFREAYKDAGLSGHRRNMELLARGLIDHVRLTEEHNHHVPDDVVQYNRLEHTYQPREGHDFLEPKRALNMYLEQPVLHYSIGTKIKPSVVKNLDQFGIKQINVHKDPPPFEPEMFRGLENLAHDPDWMTRFLGSYLEKNLLKGTYRGDVSDIHGTSYVPALAANPRFGLEGKTKGYEPKEVGPRIKMAKSIQYQAKSLLKSIRGQKDV